MAQSAYYQEVIDRINEVIDRETPLLLSLSEEQVSVKRNHQNRTVKKLVGHLIDSASNNHQRMVRLQYAPRCGHSMPNTEMANSTIIGSTTRAAV